MKSPFIALAAVAVAISSLTFAQTGQNAQPGGSDSARAGQMTSQNYTAEFVRDAASGNQMEIQLGQYVSDHAQDSQIKKFAQTLVQDHKDAQQKLKTAAQQAGIQVNDQLMPVHKAMLDELTKKTGDDLNRDFVFSAIADHHKDILEYTFASQNLSDPQLKQYASQCIPVLEKHLTTAESLTPDVAGFRDATASQR